VITRAALQSSELFEKLSSSGAIPILLPLISFAPPEDFAGIDAALLQWKRFDWVIFTSAYGVQTVVARAAALGRDLVGSGGPPSIAVVGPATKEKAEREGFRVHHEARTHLGVALAEELGDLVRGKHVLLPRSDRANPDLPAALQRLGAKVTEVVAYRTVRPSDAGQERLARVAKGEVDAILFFSPSAVHSFVELAGSQPLILLQNRVAMAAVGPVTAGALREIGVQRIVQAPEATAGAVVGALEEYFASREELKAGVRRT
jgi:uroporphyrinogen III methyltransferase / synthase